MGLSDILGAAARLGAARPHVMLIELPGGRAVRRSAEDALDDRGWRRAPSPGAADVLLVAGETTDPLAPYLDRVWAQLPGPRAQLEIGEAGEVEAALDGVVAHLEDARAQDEDADRRPDPRWVHRADGEPAEPGHMAPAGIPLAEGAQDRDALEMDVLRVPFGPALDHWPAGLVMHAELHGDIVADARLTWLGHEGPPATESERTARVLDAGASVLALAGDERRARGVRLLRGQVLARAADGPGAELEEQLRAAMARLERLLRSRLMRASLGLPAQIVADQLAERTVPGARGSIAALHDADLRRTMIGRDVGEVRLLAAALSPRLWLEIDGVGDATEAPSVGARTRDSAPSLSREEEA